MSYKTYTIKLYADFVFEIISSVVILVSDNMIVVLFPVIMITEISFLMFASKYLAAEKQKTGAMDAEFRNRLIPAGIAALLFASILSRSIVAPFAIPVAILSAIAAFVSKFLCRSKLVATNGPWN